MNTQKFMGSQSLNLANTAMKSLISLQNEIDGDFTPAGVLTASGGLVNPTGSVITATTTLEATDSGKTFAIAAASATTINIPSTPGFNANFVITTASSSYAVTFSTESTNKIYGLKTIAGTVSTLGAGVNNVVYIAKSTTDGQQQGDVINVNVINSTNTMITAISTGTVGAITTS